MSWRYLLFDYVPRELNLPWVTRYQVREEAARIPGAKKRATIAYVLGFGVAFTAIGLVQFCWQPPFLQSMLGPMFFSLLAGPLGMLLAGVLGIKLMRPFTLMALRARGYHFCLGCGYWLRDLSQDDHPKCPECGMARGYGGHP